MTKTVAERLRELPEVMERSGTFSTESFEYSVEARLNHKRSFFLRAPQGGTAELRYGNTASSAVRILPIPYEAVQSRDTLIAWIIVVLRMS